MIDVPAPWPACPLLPCAWGDAFDRLTILELKRERLRDAVSLAHITTELRGVRGALGDVGRFPPRLSILVADLATTNADLWDTENAIRACEAEGRFDAAFVMLARRVYARNADRAQLKREISVLLGSALVEQKLYGPA